MTHTSTRRSHVSSTLQTSAEAETQTHPSDDRFNPLNFAPAVDAPLAAGFSFISGDETLEADARRAARTDLPLLIMGEAGTGRSALARFIHRQSRRSGGSFVEFDCRVSGQDHLEQHFNEHLRNTGGTVLLSGLECGAAVLGDSLRQYFDKSDEGRLRSSTGAPAGMRLICEADQDLRSHVDRSLWQRLVGWPPLLLAPLRMQRRRKWHLFNLFAEQAAVEAGMEVPLSANFLLYAHVVSYGWPGNARQMFDFTRHLVGIGALADRRLQMDAEFSFFDESEAFAADDAAEAKRLSADGALRVYRNRRQRDFARALAWLQTSTSGPSWRELSKAQPGTDGRWSYGDVRWSDPHFAGSEMCAGVGQALDGALAQLAQWQDRVNARELLFDPTRTPWTEDGAIQRVVPGCSEAQLADRVAFAMIAGDITSAQTFLDQLNEAVERMSPNLPADELKRLGLTKARKITSKPRTTRARKT